MTMKHSKLFGFLSFILFSFRHLVKCKGKELFVKRKFTNLASAIEKRSKKQAYTPLIVEIQKEEICERPKRRDASLLLRPIRRVTNMTLEEFRAYSKLETAVPIIFENPNFDVDTWTPESFADECGDIPVRVEEDGGDCEGPPYMCHYVKEKTNNNNWAGLTIANLKRHNLTTMSDLLQAQTTTKGAGLYLHDAPLSHYCPPKIGKLRVLKYFSRNYDILNWNPEASNYGWKEMDNQWPSIFISGKGTGSALHCDSRMTRFWISMLYGAKLWRLIPPSEYWRMGPDFDPENEFYPGKFRADIINPDFEEFPGMDGALTILFIVNIQKMVKGTIMIHGQFHNRFPQNSAKNWKNIQQWLQWLFPFYNCVVRIVSNL